MRIGIFGSRNITDFDVRAILEDITIDIEGSIFLLGGAKGVQAIVKSYLDEYKDRYGKCLYILFKPWHLVNTRLAFNTDLFFYRNKQIIQNSDLVVVIRKYDEEDDSEILGALSYAGRLNKEITTMDLRDYTIA